MSRLYISSIREKRITIQPKIQIDYFKRLKKLPQSRVVTAMHLLSGLEDMVVRGRTDNFEWVQPTLIR